MRANERVWKRPGDQFSLAVNFDTFPMQDGETVVNSNARGALEMTAEDELGADVTSTLLESASIFADTTMGAVVKDGAYPSTYWITAVAPTSDGELMTHRFSIELRNSFYD